MRALLPRTAPTVDLVEAYAVPILGRGGPFVRANMIATLDGALSVRGRSGPVGGPADRGVFQVLRALADVVLVGAGTVRAERYGPARLDDTLRQLRQRQGKPAVPPIAVVSRAGDLDWSAPFFTQAEQRPIVFASAAHGEATRRRAETVADFVVAGEARVDPRIAIDHLRRSGYHSILLEGGPGLNADVVDAGLLDELCLTVSPRLVGGTGPRILAGPELPHPLELRIVHLLEEDGFLFYRLAVPASPPVRAGAGDPGPSPVRPSGDRPAAGP